MSEYNESYRDHVVDAEYRDVTGNDNNKKSGKKKKVSSGNGKKVWATIGLALVFGLVSSFVFNASNMVVERINKKTEAVNAKEKGSEKDATEKTVEGKNSDENEKSNTENALIDSNKSDKKIDIVGENLFTDDVDTDAGSLHSVTAVAEEAMPSIVAITNKSIQEVRSFYGMGVQQYEQTAAGSGIIIGQNDTELLIVTNAHVVESANTLTVCFIDEEAYEAEIKGTDTTNDLAIIAVKLSDISGSTMDAIKIASVGSSDNLKIGEQVVAIGNALGYGQSVTTGIVSALDRSIGGTEEGTESKYIQTDAAINPGNSGGALLNMKGELVGINSAKLANTKIEGMGYAIPIDAAAPILEELMTFATRSQVDEKDAGYLGITGFTVTDEVASQYNIPKGVYVSDTGSDSAARKAGIQQGDVIVKFDGMNIDSMNKLRERLAYYKSGETIEVVIARANDGEYEEKTVKITLESKDSALSGLNNNAQSDSQSGKDNALPNQNGNSGGSDEGNDQQETPDGSQSEYNFQLPGNIFEMFGW